MPLSRNSEGGDAQSSHITCRNRTRLSPLDLARITFVEEFATTLGRTIRAIARESMEALQRYPWPGNVRELRNIVERAMIAGNGPTLHLARAAIADTAAGKCMGASLPGGWPRGLSARGLYSGRSRPVSGCGRCAKPAACCAVSFHGHASWVQAPHF
jgi:hypothetical protein